jgi:transposase
MAIWQDLVSQAGFTNGYQSVKRFVNRIQGAQTPEAHPVIVTAPGEEAQVDYGTGPMVRDPQSGKYRRTRLFVMTLGYSRKAVRLLVFRSNSRVWAELHEKAFRRLGGVVRVVVLDNLREGVLVPDIYDPTLNPLYRDVLAHYGVVALPCRVQDPDRKGKVESGIGHTQRTPLKGLRFESLEEAQTYLDRWEAHWADTRIHGTTKRQVAAMFAEEKPSLLPLPIEPFRYYQYGQRTVHLDGCVEVEAAYYGVPPGWIGRLVNVQWNDLYVRLLDPRTGELLREHIRQRRGGYRIQKDDYPKRTPLGTVQLLARAERAGAHIGAFCQAIHRQQGELGVRRMLGVLALTKKFGLAAVEEACTAALELGVHEYRFVRRYLERRPQAPPPCSRSIPSFASWCTTAISSSSVCRNKRGRARFLKRSPKGRGLPRRCIREDENIWGFAPGPRIYRFPARIDLDWGSEVRSLPFNPGPGVGARVASLRCPILRPGHRGV